MGDTKKRDMAKEMLDLLMKKKDEGTESSGTSPSQRATRLLDPSHTPAAADARAAAGKAAAPAANQAGTFVIDFDLGNDQASDLTREGAIPEVEEILGKKDVTTSTVEDTVKQTVSRNITQKNQASSKIKPIAKDQVTATATPVKEMSQEVKKEVEEFKESSKPVLPTQFQFGGVTQQAPVSKTAPTESVSPVSKFSSTRSASIFNEVSSLVSGSEAVRVAQARIIALEKERDELRDEMEKLLASSESYQRRTNEIKAQYDTLERKHRQKVEILEEEKAVIKGRLQARESELSQTKKQNEELQSRFQNDLRRVRVRERELESRLELLKAETATLLRSKDDMIVELKRQLEQLSFELDNFRAKSADLNSKVGEFYERNHRTVKALRLALSVLELGDNEDTKNKKASG